MKIRQKLLFLMFLTMMSTLAKSQPNLSFYPFEDQFNSSGYNPAFLTSREKFTFSIFPIGGTSIGYNNQVVIRNMVSKFLTGMTTVDDYRNVLKSMVDQPTFHQNVESPLLSFTYRSNIGFFNFMIKQSESFSISAEGDVSRFIFMSDVRSVHVDQLQYMPARAIHYNEYSLGYSFKSRLNRFSAGIRAKLYFGKAAFISGLSGSIQNKSNEFILKTSGLVNISFPEGNVVNPNGTPNFTGFSTSKIINYFLNTGNQGLGVDLGIKYKITPDLAFSMSVIDFGKIRWKSNLNSKYFDGDYKLSGGNITSTTEGGVQVITKTQENYSYSNSISNLFKLTYDRAVFSMQMPCTIYAGIKYRLNPDFSISLTDRFVSIKDMSYNSFSTTANFNVNSKLSISTGYSILGNSYFNIPIALLFKRNFGQIFLGTDNLTSLLLPSLTEFAGISFGACFYLFRNNSLSDRTSNDFPFYKQKKIKKNQKNGLNMRAEDDF